MKINENKIETSYNSYTFDETGGGYVDHKTSRKMLCRTNNVALFENNKKDKVGNYNFDNYSIVYLPSNDDEEYELADFYSIDYLETRKVVSTVKKVDAYETYNTWACLKGEAPQIDFVESGEYNAAKAQKPVNSKPKEFKIKKETNGKRGRKPSNFKPQFPEGEFTMQQLAELNGKTKTYVYTFLKSKGYFDKLEEVRSISKGRGKPEKVYKYNES